MILMELTPSSSLASLSDDNMIVLALDDATWVHWRPASELGMQISIACLIDQQVCVLVRGTNEIIEKGKTKVDVAS